MDDILRPGDLHKVAAEKEMARARELADADKRRADERHHLQEAFMARQLHPEVKARVSAALRAAADLLDLIRRQLRDDVRFAGLDRRDPRPRLGHRPEDHGVEVRRAAPVLLVRLEREGAVLDPGLELDRA